MEVGSYIPTVLDKHIEGVSTLVTEISSSQALDGARCGILIA